MPEENFRFKKILVAIDLSSSGQWVAETLPDTTAEALRQAEWLAQAHSAELFYFYVLPKRAENLTCDLRDSVADAKDTKSVHDHASEVLAGLATATGHRLSKTSSKVVLGTDWIEIIREVIRNDIDLVIAGTRKQGAFHSMIFGNTGLKLIRKCPCPVWITKPQSDERVKSILVAHDLTDIGDTALKLGCSLARECNASLHVLHSIEYQNPASDEVENRKKQEVEKEIVDQLGSSGFDPVRAMIQVEFGFAEEWILSYIKDHEIQLIIMGTIARTGIAGLIVGNTAEKLLPFLPCSVLAIKPADFKSPVLLNSDEYEDELAG